MKLKRSGGKLECIAQRESFFFWGGGYDPRQEASYEAAVAELTTTRLIKPLARAAPATGSTTASPGAPKGIPPNATAHFQTALGAMGTGGPEPDFEGICVQNSSTIRS